MPNSGVIRFLVRTACAQVCVVLFFSVQAAPGKNKRRSGAAHSSDFISLSRPPPDKKPSPPPPPPSPRPGDRPQPPRYRPCPPDIPDEPWEFVPFFQFIGPPMEPAEPCCRQAEPDVVTVWGTGKMNWGPWDYRLLPCDYGEKMVDPADKSCGSVNDCLMLPVAWDCCGSLFLAGISKKQARRYVLLNYKCRPVLKWCDCPPGVYHAEDFKTSDDPDDIRLECFRGMCRTVTRP